MPPEFKRRVAVLTCVAMVFVIGFEACRLEWERPARPVAQIAESLAILDDPRAIDVVGDDPLLLSHVAWSIPGGPPRSNLHDGLKFNRVEDAMALSAWLSSNR